MLHVGSCNSNVQPSLPLSFFQPFTYIVSVFSYSLLFLVFLRLPVVCQSLLLYFYLPIISILSNCLSLYLVAMYEKHPHPSTSASFMISFLRLVDWITVGYQRTHCKGLVVPPCMSPQWPSGEAPATRTEDTGTTPRFARSWHTINFRIGTPEATLPGASRYKVNASTG